MDKLKIKKLRFSRFLIDYSMIVNHFSKTIELNHRKEKIKFYTIVFPLNKSFSGVE